MEVERMSDVEEIVCNMCKRPIKFDFERFKGDDGTTVHQFCYEYKIIEAATKAPFRKPLAS
jgi:hypothetical protein